MGLYNTWLFVFGFLCSAWCFQILSLLQQALVPFFIAESYSVVHILILLIRYILCVYMCMCMCKHTFSTLTYVFWYFTVDTYPLEPGRPGYCLLFGNNFYIKWAERSLSFRTRLHRWLFLILFLDITNTYGLDALKMIEFSSATGPRGYSRISWLLQSRWAWISVLCLAVHKCFVHCGWWNLAPGLLMGL